MNRVITVGREFGSGGRELGRRLAEQLGFACYDKEILSEIAKRTSFSEDYVAQIMEQKPVPMFQITIGRSFYPAANPVAQQAQSIYRQQHELIKELAGKSDCVIIGRCADYILRDQNPFRIFVYAQMESKLSRCKEKAPEWEKLSEKELKQRIADVDKNRAKYYEFYTGLKWGDKQNYDLCVNTTHTAVKEVAGAVAKLF